MPPHLHYVEPFFGGGAVLFARDPDRNWLITPEWKLKHGESVPAELRGCSEVVNDIDGKLMNFWRVLQIPDLFDKFVRRVSVTPFSQSGWNLAREIGDCPMAEEETAEFAAWRAHHFFVRYRQSRQGLGKDFATLSRNRTRRGMNEQASAWLSAVEGLPEAHERLRRVVILNDDAVKVIRQQDGPRTHFYCDPPYLQETRTATDAYQHEMTRQQHDELLAALSSIQGTFQLSGYRNELYDEIAKIHGWRRVDIPVDNKASSRKKKPKMVESVWMNY